MGTGHRFSETHNLIKKTYVIHYSSGVKTLYYNGPDELKDEEREAVISNARTLAEACNGLARIVNTSSINLPYVTARISRTESGEVWSVDVGSRYGMQIGSEDEAFPA